MNKSKYYDSLLENNTPVFLSDGTDIYKELKKHITKNIYLWTITCR